MLAVIAIVMIVLIGGNRMAIIKEVGQIRESLAQKFPSEEEKRRRIALWVVQHFEGSEPIKIIEVGKIESYGFLGTGGKGVSVRINKKECNEVGLILNSDDIPKGGVGGISQCFEYRYVDKLDVNLDNVKVLYWR